MFLGEHPGRCGQVRCSFQQRSSLSYLAGGPGGKLLSRLTIFFFKRQRFNNVQRRIIKRSPLFYGTCEQKEYVEREKWIFRVAGPWNLGTRVFAVPLLQLKSTPRPCGTRVSKILLYFAEASVDLLKSLIMTRRRDSIVVPGRG